MDQHPRQGDGERAASSQFADKADFAAQQLAQLLDDRQPQAGPGILPRQVAIAHGQGTLPELLENDLAVFLGNPHAGVGDRDLQPVVQAAADRHGDPAALRSELDGIGQQVDQDLLDLALVVEHDRQVGLDFADQVDVLLFAQRADHLALGGDHRPDAELGQPHIHLAGLDLSQVQDVVDQVQQQAAGLADVLSVAFLLVRQRIDA